MASDAENNCNKPLLRRMFDHTEYVASLISEQPTTLLARFVAFAVLADAGLELDVSAPAPTRAECSRALRILCATHATEPIALYRLLSAVGAYAVIAVNAGNTADMTLMRVLLCSNAGNAHRLQAAIEELLRGACSDAPDSVVLQELSRTPKGGAILKKLFLKLRPACQANPGQQVRKMLRYILYEDPHFAMQCAFAVCKRGDRAALLGCALHAMRAARVALSDMR